MTVVISNRGPHSFAQRPDGTFDVRTGSGGVASALGPLLTSGAAGVGAAWIAAAITDDDRAAVHAGAATAPGIALTLLDLDPLVYRQYYDVVSNGTLWFLHHGLFDLPRRPRFDRHFREAWEAYRTVNRTFADTAAATAGEGDVVLVQDYQLALVPGLLRAARPGPARRALHAHRVLRPELDPCPPDRRGHGAVRIDGNRPLRLPCGPLGASVHRIRPRDARALTRHRRPSSHPSVPTPMPSHRSRRRPRWKPPVRSSTRSSAIV